MTPRETARKGLDLSDASGLGPLRPFFFIEGHSFTLFKSLETASFDSAEVYKYIPALTRFNKTIPLALIEPFHSTFRHA